MKIVTVSYTSLGSPGGVPRWNRDLHSAFPGMCKHFSWDDFVKSTGRDYNIPEWEKAKWLAKFLLQKRLVSSDDVILADGFWADGYDPLRTVSICHGNWSHTTADDVAAGIPPEFPEHHAAQLDFRRRHVKAGGRLVAVSDFIADQCKLQWPDLGTIPVINNGIDLTKFVPASKKVKRTRPVVVHGVPGQDVNKGYDHITLLKREFDADVLSLDEAAYFFNSIQSERHFTKYQALAQADLVVIPSAHEGNSYFVAESLSSNSPLVCYDVGLMYAARRDGNGNRIGEVIQRRDRSPERTLEGTRCLFKRIQQQDKLLDSRGYIADFSLERFQVEWRCYVEREFGFTT